MKGATGSATRAPQANYKPLTCTDCMSDAGLTPFPLPVYSEAQL